MTIPTDAQESIVPMFQASLIRSKLLIPRPTALLHRPRVCQILEDGLQRKVTIASAPAGYGKTSALVDFAQHSPSPVCWYTADERDRDLDRFLKYTIGAIAERFPGFGQRTLAAMTALGSDLFRDPTAIVGELANEILELNTPLVLVIDDYGAVDDAFGIRTFIQRLLEVLPFNCHLMLGSRVLPAVPITRLVAKRQLVGLSGQDLRFTPQEILDLLQLSQIEASEAQAEAIAAHSEGWITGILLLADLLREDAAEALLEGKVATAETYAYLAGEVLSRQPPDIQDFLRTSAVLREMSSRLCREVVDIAETETLLADVERHNLFVTRFGRGRSATYRYHSLFREFLQQQLRQRDPVRYSQLHLRAAEWFEGTDEIEEAIYHYLSAEAYDRATTLMERVAMEWFTRGRVEILLHWASELPEEARANAPRLSLFRSRVLTDRYEYAGARQALAHAEIGFASRGDSAGLAKIHDQRAALALFESRYQDVVTEAQRALEMLEPEQVEERAGTQRLIGRAYIGLGQISEGIEQLQEALSLFRQAGSPYDVANLLQDIAHAYTSQGNLDETVTLLNEALAIRRRLGAPVPLAGVLNNLGYIHYLQGEYREALTLYEDGLAAARKGHDPRWQTYILIGLADLYRDIGIYSRAESLYRSARQVGKAAEPALEVYLLTAQAEMYRWCGDYWRARSLLDRARQLAQEKALESELKGIVSVAEGITLAESGEIQAGLETLSEAVRFLEQQQTRRELARARFLLSKAHLLNQEELEATEELRRAMALAQEIGTSQFAVAEGQHAPDLLELGKAEGISACQRVLEQSEDLRTFAQEQERGIEKPDTDKDLPDRLEIYTLGEERVVRDEDVISSSDWRAAMSKELFFYILLHGPLERDEIGLAFWPGLPKKKITDRFHTTLYRLRRALGADAVVVDDEGQYQLGELDYWFDVEEFEALAERARLLPPYDWQTEDLWRRAAALYKGDFLPEVERVWCVPKRESLRETYVEALVGVGQCHEARKEFEGAIEWYRRALEVNELREDIHRHIMRCYEEAGRRPEALEQYQKCKEILRRELGIDPSAETRKLYAEIAGKNPD